MPESTPVASFGLSGDVPDAVLPILHVTGTSDRGQALYDVIHPCLGANREYAGRMVPGAEVRNQVCWHRSHVQSDENPSFALRPGQDGRCHCRWQGLAGRLRARRRGGRGRERCAAARPDPIGRVGSRRTGRPGPFPMPLQRVASHLNGDAAQPALAWAGPRFVGARFPPGN